MRLIETAELYLSERCVSEPYANQIRHRIKHFVCFAGLATLTDESPQNANRWIAHLCDLPLTPKTIKAYRACLLAVWRWAYDERLTDVRPERIRRVRVPESTPEAWTLAELRLLLAAAETMTRIVPHTGIPQCVWWTAFIHLGYATGLRLGDLLSVRWCDVRVGYVCVTQRKTGRAIARPLTSGAVAALEQLPREGPFVLPWPGARTGVYNAFRRLVLRAGIRHGTTRYLRRSGASHVERDNPGLASRFLGHLTPGLAARHYLDPSITQQAAVRPPEL